MTGKLVIFSAPSGSGKTTIVRHILEQGMQLEFSISACSRNPRESEKDGFDYYFISVEEFRDKIDKGEFIEWEEVYPGHYYGTLKSEVERIWNAGKHVIFDVDVAGGLRLKQIYGNQALAVFIMPPSIKELEKRLTTRSTDTAEKIKIRLEKAEKEMGYAGHFDLIIINDKLEEASNKAYEAVMEFISG